MKTNILRYTVVISKEGKDFIANVPTLGIADFGKTIDQAKKNVQEAIACHIEGLVKTKTPVPAPDADDSYISQAEVSIPGKLKFAF